MNDKKVPLPSVTLSLVQDPPRFLFFTGKGGVGKTSLACACALSLADAGKRVLLVSTDPASNLDEMLGVELSDRPRAIPGARGLDALNIDPFAWVVNRSLAATGTRDPVLASRLAGESAQLARVAGGLAQRTYVVPWVPRPQSASPHCATWWLRACSNKTQRAMKAVVLESTLTCPKCGHRKQEVMPTDACQYFYECTQCGNVLRPKPGDCCVFCSYGSVKCPSVQSHRGGCG